MNMVGYTVYLHGMGAEYYPMCLLGDLCQSAAEAEGKEAWCIELDSRTYIPLWIYNRNTLAVLGSGVKGILYYQWRGDQPVPGVPHPNSCGLLNYDGSKTHNFENSAQVNRFIHKMSNYLMGAKRPTGEVGLLHSDYAAFICDARENLDMQKRGVGLRNSYMVEYNDVYRRLREAGHTVPITDAEHLNERIKVLYLADLTGVQPQARSLDPNVALQILQGEGYKLLVVTNLSATKQTVTARIQCNFPMKKATYHTFTDEQVLSAGELLTVEITDGGIIVAEE